MARPRSFDETTVLTAIRDLFWRQGYVGTSMEDLERASGLRRTSLYQAFGNKEALYLRVLGDYQTAGREKLRELLATGSSNTPRTGVRALFAYAIDSFITDPDRKGCFLVNAATGRAADCPRTADLLVENRGFFLDTVTAHLAAGGVPEARARVQAAAIHTVYSGLSVAARLGAGRAELEGVVEVALRSVFGVS